MNQHAYFPEAVTRAEMAEMAAGCVCLNVRKTARAITQLYDGVLQPSGLRAGQFGLLGAIALTGEATLTRLAEELVMDRTTLTRNLKPLERRGLIAIAPGADRRSRVATVTEAGRQAMLAALPLWHEVHQHVVTRLGDKQYHALLAELQAATRLAEPD
jgi:DNA-binding MarR family transcriptional regulator